jgi:hypothetical protein
MGIPTESGPGPALATLVALAAAALIGACASGGSDSDRAEASYGCPASGDPAVGVRYERFERRPTVRDTPTAILHRASEFLSESGMTVQAISVNEIRAYRGRSLMVSVATGSPGEDGVETLVCGAWEVREDPFARPRELPPPGTEGSRGAQPRYPVPKNAAELELMGDLMSRIQDVPPEAR